MNITIEKDFSLQNYNSFGVSVKSANFCRLTHRDQLDNIASLPKPHLFLGGGSNLLFTQDYSGTIIHNELKGIALEQESDQYYYVRAEAGENWHQFVSEALRNQWYGLEVLSLIPGTVGASPIQNIGAYGLEVGDRIESVEVYDTSELVIRHLTVTECDFGYRDSRFKQERGRYLVLSVLFKLLKKPILTLKYRALEEWFSESNLPITAENIAKAVIDIRQSKLPDPEKIGNAGSFFQNPVVKIAQFERLLIKHPQLVHYPYGNGEVKLAAGQLIELAGFKGLYQNNVGMYEKQALILVNLGGASGEMLYLHALTVKETVKRIFNIDLMPEPIIL